MLKILKLGGSVITHKHLESALNQDRLDILIGEIGQWLSSGEDHRLIFIAGAGSFGHPFAHRYAINAPNPDKDTFGFLATTTNMRHMGLQVARMCQAAGVPAFPVSPSTIFTTEAGRIVAGDLRAVSAALERGLVPLLWGDAVFDTVHRFRILSGDQINSYLCEQLGIHTLLFGTDVDGVYDDNPTANPTANRILRIDDNNYEDVLGVLSSSPHVDVTGGMRGKIMEIHATRFRPLACTIYDARQEGQTLRALRGDAVGTRIAFD